MKQIFVLSPVYVGETKGFMMIPQDEGKTFAIACIVDDPRAAIPIMFFTDSRSADLKMRELAEIIRDPSRDRQFITLFPPVMRPGAPGEKAEPNV